MKKIASRLRRRIHGFGFCFGLVLVLGLGAGTTSCRTRQFSSGRLTSAPSDSQGVLTACMGIQGNGHLYASHMGTLISLFENSIDPAIIIGGSSGSIVGSIGRALMNNPSLRKTRVMYRKPSQTQGATVGDEEIELTYPQKAALILGASEDVMNGFLFLPGFDEVTDVDFFKYLRLFGKNLKEGQLPAQSHFKILNIEPTVGTAVLITAFFQLTDFGPILRDANLRLSVPSPDYLGDYRARKDAVSQAFFKYTKAKTWSLAQVIGLMTDPSVVDTNRDTPQKQERFERLQELKTAFQEDEDFVKGQTTAEDLASHTNMMDNLLFGSFWTLSNGVLRFSNAALSELSSLVPDGLSKDRTHGTRSNRILNGTFWLPDPDLIQAAYRGRVPLPESSGAASTGGSESSMLFKIPKGMIIHSTFLRGKPRWIPVSRREWWAPRSQSPSANDEGNTGQQNLPGSMIRSDVMTFDAALGFENLYQGYIVGDDPEVLEQMQARRNTALQIWQQGGQSWRDTRQNVAQQNFGKAPFLLYDLESLIAAQGRIKDNPVDNLSDNMPRQTFPRHANLKNGEVEAYLPPSQILLFGSENADVNSGDFRPRGLNFGIQASAGEPGAFRRYPMRWTERDRALNSPQNQNLVPTADEGSAQDPLKDAILIPFGGWGENVPLSSVAHLKQCQNADLFVSSAKDEPGNNFQSGALVAVLRGPLDTRKPASAPKAAPDIIKEAETHFQRLTAAAFFSRAMREKPWVNNDLDFDTPCEAGPKKLCSVAEVKKINEAISPLPWGESRFNLALVGYQVTSHSLSATLATLATQGRLAPPKNNFGQFYAFGQRVYEPLVVDLREWTNKGKPFWNRPFLPRPLQQIQGFMDAVREGNAAPNIRP